MKILCRERERVERGVGKREREEGALYRGGIKGVEWST